MLGALGLASDEEAVYRACLTFGAAPLEVAQLAAEVGRSVAEVEASAHRLVTEHGLLHRDADGRLRVVPPEIALEAATETRLGLLHAVRGQIGLLAETYRAALPAAAAWRDVDSLDDSEALAGRVRQLYATATAEVCALVRDPYVPTLTAVDGMKLFALFRGVPCRTVYTAEALTDRLHATTLDTYAEFGEQARVSSGGLATNLTLVDGERAVLVDHSENEARPRGVLVAGGPIVAALRELFDTVWRAAIPVDVAESSDSLRSGMPDDDKKLMVMLAANMKDAAIARQLGCSERTAQRRVAALCRAFRARSRGDLVVLLASGGLTAPEPPP